MFLIIEYPDLVQDDAGHPAEWDEENECVPHYETRKEAEENLKRQYPGKTLREIMVYAQKRVEWSI